MTESEEQRTELLASALELAQKILAGTIDPNESCAEIGRICERLNFPDPLFEFYTLSHEQEGHEHLGFNRENSRPLILEAAKKLVEEMGGE